MNQITESIIVEALAYFEKEVATKFPKKLVFHSSLHTYDVLKNVQIIGNYSLVNEMEMNLLKFSAIFHDVGYAYTYKGHEEKSAQIANEFLTARRVHSKSISIVLKSILATQIPQMPQDKIGRILCDADLMHLTYENYFEDIDLLRIEWSLIGRNHLTKENFHNVSLNFFQKHTYHTNYGKNILEPRKKINLDKIKNKLKIAV